MPDLTYLDDGLWQNDHVPVAVTLADKHGTPIDTTGLTIAAVYDPDGTTPVTLPSTGPTAGVLTVTVTTAVTATTGTKYVALTTPTTGGTRTLAVLAIQVGDRTP